jgi:hypothetical protein
VHGAQAVGIEYRTESLAKGRFVKEHLKLDSLELYQDDVRNLSREKYGEFDVVICSSILYHLDAADVFRFVRSIYAVCKRMVYFDTEIAIRPKASLEFDSQTYHGAWVREHDESAGPEAKLSALWAPIDNVKSFYLTPPSRQSDRDCWVYLIL